MGTREQLLQAQMDELRHMFMTQTQALERLAGQVINNTLEVWSGVIPADGILTGKDYGVAAGAVRIRNLSATNPMYVSSAGSNSTRPTGTGTWVVPAGQTDVVPLASHVFTVYGTAGDGLCLAVFTAPVRPVGA
jgi:hypothetical protein